MGEPRPNVQRPPKKLGTLFLLLAWIMSAGSAAAAAEPADPHRAAQNAETEMLKCFFSRGAALDDHVSDASTIAKGVVTACYRQVNDSKHAFFEEQRAPVDAMLFDKEVDQAVSSIATEVVLKVRAATKH